MSEVVTRLWMDAVLILLVIQTIALIVIARRLKRTRP